MAFKMVSFESKKDGGKEGRREGGRTTTLHPTAVLRKCTTRFTNE